MMALGQVQGRHDAFQNVLMLKRVVTPAPGIDQVAGKLGIGVGVAGMAEFPAEAAEGADRLLQGGPLAPQFDQFVVDAGDLVAHLLEAGLRAAEAIDHAGQLDLHLGAQRPAAVAPGQGARLGLEASVQGRTARVQQIRLPQRLLLRDSERTPQADAASRVGFPNSFGSASTLMPLHRPSRRTGWSNLRKSLISSDVSFIMPPLVAE